MLTQNSYSFLLEIWKSCSKLAKDKSKMSLAALMDNNAPILLPNYEIQVMLDNKLQEQELISEKIDLLNFLRVGLRNFDITISSIIAQSNASKKPYTSKDKYNYFVEKNPAIEELRKVFNLNID